MTDTVIIISGPTGVGKSSLAIKLAKILNTDIISCDSMQIYKGMDIGTAKVRKEDMNNIKHHMIDIIHPKDNYSVQEYQKDATKIIEVLHKVGKIPILVGGTGLYINSIYYDYEFSNVEPNMEFRQKMEKIYDSNPQSLLDKLYLIDSNLYSKLTIKDKKKIIRALEVFEFSGKTISTESKKNSKFNIFLYVLNQNRQELYENINRRVDKMIENGLLDEVNSLLFQGSSENDQAMKAIGYREIIPFIRGEINYDQMIEKLKQDSRRYAKRQITWFKRIDEAVWLDKDKLSQEDMINIILEDINGL